MKEFSLNFKMESSAFDEYPANEVYRILHEISNKIENIIPIEEDYFYGAIQDINGNTIGELVISSTE